MIRLKHGHDPDNRFDKKELSMGIRDEREHTNNTEIAKEIAKGHLAQNKHYYSKLKRCGL